MSVTFNLCGFVEYNGQELMEEARKPGKFVYSGWVKKGPKIMGSINRIISLLNRNRLFTRSFQEISKDYHIDHSFFKDMIGEYFTDKVYAPEHVFEETIKIQRCLHQKWEDFIKPYDYKICIANNMTFGYSWRKFKAMVSAAAISGRGILLSTTEDQLEVEFYSDFDHLPKIIIRETSSRNSIYEIEEFDKVEIEKKLAFLWVDKILQPDILARSAKFSKSWVFILKKPIWTAFTDDLNSIFYICNLAIKHRMKLKVIVDS